MVGTTVEPQNKGHFGNEPFVLCLEVVPISEVHSFLLYYASVMYNKVGNALICMTVTIKCQKIVIMKQTSGSVT